MPTDTRELQQLALETRHCVGYVRTITTYCAVCAHTGSSRFDEPFCPTKRDCDSLMRITRACKLWVCGDYAVCAASHRNTYCSIVAVAFARSAFGWSVPRQHSCMTLNGANASASAGADAQRVLDVQDVPSTSCRICMADHLQHPARIQACGHQFW